MLLTLSQADPWEVLSNWVIHEWIVVDNWRGGLFADSLSSERTFCLAIIQFYNYIV